MTTHDAAYWDDRYREHPSVWGIPPNRFVEQELAGTPPGRALDLACGEGRNALWLAARGWQVDAVDWSAVALDKGRGHDPSINWVCADVTDYRSPHEVDLALLCYLQVGPSALQAVLRNAQDALAPGGTLLVIAHDSRNLTDGTGGPQDPSVLYTAADVLAVLDGLRIDRAEEVLRPVDGAERPAIDCLVRATRAP